MSPRATPRVAVLERLDPHLRADQLVLDMGSSDPAHSVVHAARLAARGIGWVDAPVSGGPEGASTGTLAIMAGGAEAHVARARPVLEAHQLIVGLTIEAVAEALTLAERNGRRLRDGSRSGARTPQARRPL